jgi:hypothetical protein
LEGISSFRGKPAGERMELKSQRMENFWIIAALITGWVVIQFFAPRPAAPT